MNLFFEDSRAAEIIDSPSSVAATNPGKAPSLRAAESVNSPSSIAATNPGKAPYLRAAESVESPSSIAATNPGKAPYVVFIHGGYWQALDVNSSAYFKASITSQGFRFVALGYDLAPKVRSL